MKRALILPALLVLSACGDSPDEHLAKANTAFTAHDYAAARIHLNAVLAARPQDRAAMMLQARTLLGLGDGDAAGVLIGKLAGGKPAQGELAELAGEAALLRRAPDVVLSVLAGSTSAESWRLRSVAALQKQDLGAAETYMAKAAAAGGNARIFADYARLLLVKGDIAAATAMAARAEQADAAALGTLLVGGELAARRGDLAAALRRFEQADKLYPQNIAAMTGKAAVLGELGRTEDFEAAMKPLAAAVPGDPTVTYLRARMALSRKDWAGVRALVQPVLAGLPQQDPLRLVYAEALLHLKQNEQAIAQSGPIARARPDNRAAVRLLAEAQLAAGDARAALNTLRPIAASPQARAEELALMARIATAAGDPAAATFAERASRPTPQALGADVAEGDAAIQAGNWGRAVVAYDRILASTDGRNPVVLNNMAYAQFMLGNHDKANAFAARALKAAPDVASVLDTAGWILFKSGKDQAEGRRLLRLAAARAPGNQVIKAHLAEAERSS